MTKVLALQPSKYPEKGQFEASSIVRNGLCHLALDLWYRNCCQLEQVYTHTHTHTCWAFLCWQLIILHTSVIIFLSAENTMWYPHWLRSQRQRSRRKWFESLLQRSRYVEVKWTTRPCTHQPSCRIWLKKHPKQIYQPCWLPSSCHLLSTWANENGLIKKWWMTLHTSRRNLKAISKA